MNKVSIIIAAYNIGEYIDKCLTSVLNQTLKSIEIIVVNDGSTDNTLEKVEKFFQADSRILIITQENKGSIEARKSGLQKASGEYILFVDGDDWLELDALEILYDNAKKQNSDIVIYNCFKAYDDKPKEFINMFRNGAASETDLLKQVLLFNIGASLWSKFINRAFIIENQMVFPEAISYAEDLATTVSLFLCNPRVSFESRALYNYYDRTTSITNKSDAKVLEVNVALNHIEKQLKKYDLYNVYEEEFQFLVHEQIIQYLLDKYYKNAAISESLYGFYKNRNINILENKYFLEKCAKKGVKYKFRTKLYHQSFQLGRSFDVTRGVIKFIVNKH